MQDRFRMHNNQFMREVTNLGKRSNSAFTDYQKAVTAIRKQPIIIKDKRIRVPINNQEEESDQS